MTKTSHPKITNLYDSLCKRICHSYAISDKIKHAPEAADYFLSFPSVDFEAIVTFLFLCTDLEISEKCSVTLNVVWENCYMSWKIKQFLRSNFCQTLFVLIDLIWKASDNWWHLLFSADYNWRHHFYLSKGLINCFVWPFLSVHIIPDTEHFIWKCIHVYANVSFQRSY